MPSEDGTDGPVKQPATGYLRSMQQQNAKSCSHVSCKLNNVLSLLDFDSEIESGKSKLSDILDREVAPPEDHNNSTENFSFGSFSSTITKKRADGVSMGMKCLTKTKLTLLSFSKE